MLHTEGKRIILSSAVNYSPFLAEWERGNVTFPALSRQTIPPCGHGKGQQRYRDAEIPMAFVQTPQQLPRGGFHNRSTCVGVWLSLCLPFFSKCLHPHSWAGQSDRGKCFSRDSGTDVSLLSWAFMALLWLLEGPGTLRHTQIPAPPLRYCSAPLITCLPSQDPQVVVGSPELVIQPLPMADKYHVVLKNGWICAVGSFWGGKLSSVKIFLLKIE